jgi:hypothetical protein
MKKLFLLSFVAVLLFSCSDKETVSLGYSYGISSYYSTSNELPTDLATIEAFLIDHNCQMTSLIFTGKTTKECDAQALARFNESIAAFSYANVVDLNLDASTTFKYTCSRLVNPDKEDSETLYIGTFAYPQE